MLLDEIGRGTATWDGVSIAWAVSEHLHERVGCKTVFATHYHELTQLADEFVSVRNYNVAVQEVGDRILFLHRLQPGGADRSYGIEVGRLAGLPAPVIARARALLRVLEGEQLVPALGGGRYRRAPRARRARAHRRRTDQLGLFARRPRPRWWSACASVDMNALTPLQALALLGELAEAARAAELDGASLERSLPRRTARRFALSTSSPTPPDPDVMTDHPRHRRPYANVLETIALDAAHPLLPRHAGDRARRCTARRSSSTRAAR